MTASFTKDPSAVLDYIFDWSAWLGTTETILSHVITVPTGIVKDSSSEAEGKVTVWLSGGTDGADYTIACKIVTSAARTDERTISISCRNR